MATAVAPDTETRPRALPDDAGVPARSSRARQELFFEGLVRGTTHLGVGQEAVAAGFAAAMRDDDYTFATYRGHNHALVARDADGPALRGAVRPGRTG
jgi:pyruvate dehydrogenase E1 component alpha subunit